MVFVQPGCHRGLHRARPRRLPSEVIDELDVGVTPDRLSVLISVTGCFLSALNIFELDCRRLLFQMAVDADNLAKVTEKGVNLDVGELLLRHVLDVDREAPRIVNH